MAIVANTDFLSVYGLRALILEMAPSVDVVILPDSPTLSQSVGIYSSIFSFVSISGVSAIVVPEKSDESFLRKLLGGVLNPVLQQTILTKNGKTILSKREIEVLRLVVRGLINKEIADQLGISILTVVSHRKHISAKLGIKTVSGLTVYALMNGIK